MVVRGATDHDAVERRQLRRDRVAVVDAAIDDEDELRKVGLQRPDDVVAQRRQRAVFLRADAAQPGVARVDDEDAAAAFGDGADEVAHEAVVLGAVEADAVLTVKGIETASRIAATQAATSRGSAIRQAPNAPRCTRSTRAAPQLRLIRHSPSLAESRAFSQVRGLAAAELQRHRLLGRIEVEVARDVAVQERRSSPFG